MTGSKATLELASQASLHLQNQDALYPIEMEMKERIRAARKNKGLTQDAVGSTLGVTKQAVSNWERGEDKPGIEQLRGLASLFGVTLDELVADPPQDSSLSEEGTVRPSPALPPIRGHMPQDVEVKGVAAGGRDADFYLNGQTVDFVRRPAGIAHQRGVFALNVTGTSMWPKFEDRALVYVSSAKRPLIGDYVVVELHPLSEGADVPGFIKRLVKQTATKLICEQFNPKKKVEFDLKRVKAIYRVIPLEELLGI